MGIDFGGAAVGAAFNELFVAVREVVQTIRALFAAVREVVQIIKAFGFQLKKIQNTLDRDWDEFHNRLDHNPKEMRPIKDLLNKGKGLVEKCSSIHRFNMRKKYMHSNKLKAFNAELLGDFKLYIDLLDARNNGETLCEVREMRIEVNRLISSGKTNSVALQSGFGAVGNLAVPDAPDFIVGSVLEASLRKLREQLLEEGVSVIVVTAPGGCGKMTLLKKLCHDNDIEGMCD